MIQTAPAGIATATEQSQLHTANENIHLVSGNHTDISAGQSLTAHAVESLNLFAQSSGIKVQANQGKVEVQAQNDELQLNALKDATLTSSAGKITIAAKEEVLITCKGAYIKLSNGEVEIGSPKVVRVRAPLEVTGAEMLRHPLPRFIKNKGVDVYYHYDALMPVVNAPFEAYFEDGTIISGILDENGYAHIEDAPEGRFHVLFGEDPREWIYKEPEEKRVESRYTEEEIQLFWLQENNKGKE